MFITFTDFEEYLKKINNNNNKKLYILSRDHSQKL